MLQVVASRFFLLPFLDSARALDFLAVAILLRLFPTPPEFVAPHLWRGLIAPLGRAFVLMGSKGA